MGVSWTLEIAVSCSCNGAEFATGSILVLEESG